jgi:FNIP Repeat
MYKKFWARHAFVAKIETFFDLIIIAMSFAYIFSIQSLLWPILDFLTKLDVVLVAKLCRDSRRCCTGYCLQHDTINPPKHLPSRFSYKRAIVHDLASLAQLPATLQSLHLGYQFNQPLAAGILPAALQSLHLGHYFNQPLAAGVLPTTLQSLDLGYYFNQPLAAGVLPANLQSLHLGICFDQPLINGVLPASLQSLNLGYYFNQQLGIEDVIRSLPNLQKLTGYACSDSPAYRIAKKYQHLCVSTSA